MRRFTRLALGSKKFENHCHMVALHAVWYNFVKMTPAMADGVSDRLWAVDDIAALIERNEAMEDGSLIVG
jgi:hypothetical protein